MDLTQDEIMALLALQTVDRDLGARRKALDELPQRGLILDARQKRASIAEKQVKAAGLRRDTLKKITKITDEDASLTRRQQSIEAAIEAAQGDFRNLEARTKELAGIARRRAVLTEDLDKATDELAKIEALERQIDSALEDISAREASVIASFQEEGGRLKASIMKLEQERNALVSRLGKEVLRAYEKAAARAGGVALCRLEEGRCGACRTRFDEGRLIELRSQAPLGICPSCKRLMIIS